ncbi:MAG: metal-sensing transcriptional repressor [Polyangiales bacterium]
MLQQVAAARGALNGLVAQLIEEHLRQHVLGGEGARSVAARSKAASEIIEVVRSYLK